MSYEEETLCTKQIDLFRWRFVDEQETYAIKIHGMILLKYIHDDVQCIMISFDNHDFH